MVAFRNMFIPWTRPSFSQALYQNGELPVFNKIKTKYIVKKCIHPCSSDSPPGYSRGEVTSDSVPFEHDLSASLPLVPPAWELSGPPSHLVPPSDSVPLGRGS